MGVRRPAVAALACIALGAVALTGCQPTDNVKDNVDATSLPNPVNTRDVVKGTSTPPKAKPKPAPKPAPKVVHYAGRGDKIVRLSIGTQPVALAVTHVGSSNFAIEPEDSSGATSDVSVNAIGNYKGKVLINTGSLGENPVTTLKITADGSWTIGVTPLGLLRQWNGAAMVSGRGDDVFRVTGVGPSDGVKITHHGESNFAVEVFGGDFSGDPIVNEIGDYAGEVQFDDGTVLVAVTADGVWTMTKT